MLLLILISHGFMKTLQKAAAGALRSQVLLQRVSLQSVAILGRIVPPAFFLSILYTLGRMYRDSEMTAKAAGGRGARAHLSGVFPVGRAGGAGGKLRAFIDIQRELRRFLECGILAYGFAHPIPGVRPRP